MPAGRNKKAVFFMVIVLILLQVLLSGCEDINISGDPGTVSGDDAKFRDDTKPVEMKIVRVMPRNLLQGTTL